MEKDTIRSTLEDTEAKLGSKRQHEAKLGSIKRKTRGKTCQHVRMRSKSWSLPSSSRPIIDGHECLCVAAHILATTDSTVFRILLQSKQSLSYLSALISHF